MRIHTVIISTLLIMASMGFSEKSLAQHANKDIAELYPENNVSVQYFVGFRAREGVPGHAFVVLGRNLDNGLQHIEAIVGFYPVNNEKNVTGLKNVAYGPGVIKFNDYDLKAINDGFDVNIDQSKVPEILAILEGFDEASYSLLSKNCVHMMLEIARNVGISIELAPGMPYAAMKELQRIYEAEKRRQIEELKEKAKPVKIKPQAGVFGGGGGEPGPITDFQSTIDIPMGVPVTTPSLAPRGRVIFHDSHGSGTWGPNGTVIMFPQGGGGGGALDDCKQCQLQ